MLTCNYVFSEGIKAQNERRDDGPKGLGDFQRRLNRDRMYEDRRDRRNDRSWDATPRSERGGRGEDAPSVRVPNLPWDSTPRRASSPGSSSVRNRNWDAPTPRRIVGDEEEGGAAIGLDMRAWEEEQTRLDRDWYMGAEEGGVAGDEEHNPLAQYEDLAVIKQAEVATKQVVSALIVTCMS